MITWNYEAVSAETGEAICSTVAIPATLDVSAVMAIVLRTMPNHDYITVWS